MHTYPAQSTYIPRKINTINWTMWDFRGNLRRGNHAKRFVRLLFIIKSHCRLLWKATDDGGQRQRDHMWLRQCSFSRSAVTTSNTEMCRPCERGTQLDSSHHSRHSAAVSLTVCVHISASVSITRFIEPLCHVSTLRAPTSCQSLQVTSPPEAVSTNTTTSAASATSATSTTSTTSTSQ